MNLTSNRSVVALAFLSGLLLATNAYIFLTRDWESSYYPADYATLYYPLEVPSVRSWDVEAIDRLRPEIAWDKRPAQWQLFAEGKPVRTMAGDHPRIDLTGMEITPQDYVLKPLPEGFGPDLKFTIRYISSGFYAKRGMRQSEVYRIITDIPNGPFERRPLAYWLDDYKYVAPEKLAEADRIIREEMQIREADPTLVKMEKIFGYLRVRLQGAGGVPKDDFRWMDPCSIFQEMVGGTGKGYCTQHAQIYLLFANRAGVPTRYVSSAHTEDNTIFYTGHSWAESFIAEQGRWAFVDSAHSIICVRNKQGEVLNSVDLLNLNQHDAFEGVTARILKDWEWAKLEVAAEANAPVTVPFTLVNRVVRQEFNKHTILKYRRPPNVEDLRDIYSMVWKDSTFAWANFRRYLYEPPLAYSLLPTAGRQLYLLRQSLFAGFIASTSLLLGLALRRRSAGRLQAA